MSLLITYNLPSSRLSLLARYSELQGAMDVVSALVMAQAAGQLDSAGYRKAANIALAFQNVISAVQDTDDASLTVGEVVALARVKRGLRDAALVFPWPYNPAGTGEKIITLTPKADAALTRLSYYDPVRDFSDTNGVSYGGQAHNLGAMLSDMDTLCVGFSFTRTTPETLEARATLSRLR